MEIKKCKSCGKTKYISCFDKNNSCQDGHNNKCKSCRKKDSKKYYQKNKEQIIKKSKKYYQENKKSVNNYKKTWYKRNEKSLKKYAKEYRTKNKIKIQKEKKEHYTKNKTEILEDNRKRKIINKEKYKKQDKIYRQKNKSKINKRQREYDKRKRHSDPFYRIKRNIRSLIKNSFKKGGFSKTSKTAEILGCTFEEFFNYIMNHPNKKNWMAMSNYGIYTGKEGDGWDLDHIVAVSNAKTIDEFIKLNHHANFQPLDSYINRNVKRAK